MMKHLMEVFKNNGYKKRKVKQVIPKENKHAEIHDHSTIEVENNVILSYMEGTTMEEEYYDDLTFKFVETL
jgi:hypothetical protein